MDDNNAFLNGILTEEVYMQQLPGLTSFDSHLVCKLKKVIYVMKQNHRVWFDRLTTALHSFGFVTSKCDLSLFTLTTSSYIIFMLVYVDDIIVTGSSLVHIQQLVDKLHAHFSLKQLGTLHFFLGIEVTHLANGTLFLSQTKYINDLLVKTNMSEAKSLPIPMVSNLKHTKQGSDYLPDPM